MYIRILSKPVGEEGIRYDAIKDNSKLYFNQRHCHRRNGFRDFSGIQKTVLLIPKTPHGIFWAILLRRPGQKHPPKLRAEACHCKTHRGTPRGWGRCIVTGTGIIRPSVSQIKEKAPLLPKVQTGNAHQHKKFTDNHHPKAKTLIKLCKPPIICRHIWIISALAGQIPMAQQQRRTRRCSSTVPIWTLFRTALAAK